MTHHVFRVSGHSRYADVKPDDESLLCAAGNICSPVLDQQKWEWPETLRVDLRFRVDLASLLAPRRFTEKPLFCLLQSCRIPTLLPVPG